MGLEVVKRLNTFRPIQKKSQHAQFCQASSYCTAFWQLAFIIEEVQEQGQRSKPLLCMHLSHLIHQGRGLVARYSLSQCSTCVIVLVLLWPFRISSLVFSFYGFEKCRCRIWQVHSPIPISIYLLYDKFFFLNKMLPFQKKKRKNNVININAHYRKTKLLSITLGKQATN